tara:strand:- start:1894 stop:2109 length:216 start_codon:yes stop_codon:yes gene_type:complete
MKEQILALYKTLPVNARAGICDLVARLIFAVENDPEIIPLLMERPSEQECVERHRDELISLKSKIVALLQS